MAGQVWVVVEDLFFLSRIQQTARLLGVDIQVAQPAGLVERLRQKPARAVIFDLNHRSGSVLDALRELKSNGITVPVIGFVSHVQGELIAEARAAGCDTVIARSALTEKLPEILRNAKEEW